jgi:hypothetical protein
MPKLLHEVVTHILRSAPETLVRLLPPELALRLPAQLQPRVTTAELPDIQILEYRADAVLLFGEDDGPLAAIIAEVQNDFSRRKLYTYPAYWTLARAKYECPTLVVIVALDPDVAAAYRAPIDLGFGRGFVTPVVVSADNIPRITDRELARAYPQLAVLSAVAHGRESGAEHIAYAAFSVIPDLDSEAQLFYPDAIYATLNKVALRALDQLMRTADDRNPFHSEFARRYWFEGEAKGKIEGKLEGEAKLLLKLLRLKGFVLPPELHARITDCQDLDQLETWAGHLLTAQTLADVFPDAV